MITFIDEKGTEHSALVAYSVTNAVNGELSVKGTIYTNDKVLHGIGRGWRFRLDDEYFRITYAKPNDTGRQIEVEFDAVHQFFYDMSKSMVYTTLNGSKPFETYLQAIFSNSGYTYNLETTVGSIRKENFGNKSRLALFNDIIKAAGLEFSVRGHVIRILKRVGTDLSTIVRKDFNMNELKIEKDINSFVTYQRGLGAWKDDEDHSKGRYETSYESPLSAIYGRIEADPVVDERYKDTGKLLERLKENVDKSYKVSVEIDMEDLSQAGYRISRPNPGDYIMAINETLGFRQKVRIVSFTSEYDVGGNLISRKVVCNDIGTVQRVTSEISHLSRTLTDSIEGSERALQTATRALVSADGKNTNYFGDVKPLDVPKGTLRKGDRLFLTVGDKKQLYFWNEAEWELEPTEFDHEKFDMEFNRKSQEIKKTIQENRQKAEESLRNAGASTLIAQEAKRIGLDSVAKLEEFKKQATSAQTALSGDLDVLKRTIANDIRPKQVQVETEIAKQVEALIQTKKELSGVKSAQATYEESTTQRLAELTNLANGKASKSELTQTAEELKSRIASVQVGGTNLYALSKNSDIWKGGHVADFKMDISSGEISFKTTGLDPYVGEATTHPRTASSRNGVRIPVIAGKSIYVTISNPIFAKNFISYFDENGNTVKHYQYYNTNSFVISPKELTGVSFVTLRFGCGGSNFEIGDVLKTKVKVEYGTIPTNWSPAPEDVENQISAIESNFKQRADSLEAGVSRLTEGLKTKADSSALTLLSDSIKQSVKRLETETDNKFAQKLSTAEFEVRASGIRQEIVNATKDKADKTLVTAEAGRLREELASLSVGGRNLLKGSKGPFKPNRNPANFDNNTLYSQETSVYLVQNEKYRISAKSDGNFTSWHSPNNENDNVVLWLMDKAVSNYQIVSDAKTATTGTEFVWNRPTGIYHLRVNTYRKDTQKLKSVWEVKVEQGSFKTGWSPAPEDVDDLITEAKATFERTAQGLRTDLSAIQTYVNQDGQRQDAFQRYVREESAKQATAVRELVTRDYVGKATYQEDVKGINQRIEAVKTSANKEIASQIASYRQSVDGKFTDISSQITTYKQDLGGQISGLSNRLTSSEQGTTTQISNLSNRINSNKQGTDNQISNLKTQVATNKDNAELQMGRISDQVSANKANADSQFANVSNQLARKVETTDFQRVKETSQLYERILGNTENGIADKVARMAMTNQLFQVEVSKVFENHRNLFLSSTATKGYLGNAGIIYAANSTQKEITSDFISVEPNENIIFQHWVTLPDNGMAFTAWQFFDKNKNPIDVRRRGLNAYKTTTGKQHNINQIIIPANAYFIRVSARMYNDGLIKIERGSAPSDYSVAPEDTDEAIRSVQSQLAGSWAVQNLTSAGSIVSQINATNNQILIEAEKIRLKGKTLLDELTAIQGYFKRLFVGEGTFATLNADVIRTNSITADKLVMDMAMARRFVSSDIFTDTLAAKEAFINKLRSVVVTATLLEGYKGRIGGFQIGTHEKDSSVYWITGENQFSVGMSNGSGQWSQTALWVNWGNNWGYPGDYAWYVKNNGKMYCYNTAEFWNTPVVHGDLRVTGHIYYNNENSGKSGYWIHSSKYSNFEPSNNYLYLYYSGSGYDWIPMNKEISDRRYKSNIEASTVSGLDVINNLKTYRYRKEYDGKVEDISCGIMAQDVQKYAPEAFYENPDGAYSYNTFALVPYLIKAIQELNKKIEKLEKTA